MRFLPGDTPATLSVRTSALVLALGLLILGILLSLAGTTTVTTQPVATPPPTQQPEPTPPPSPTETTDTTTPTATTTPTRTRTTITTPQQTPPTFTGEVETSADAESLSVNPTAATELWSGIIALASGFLTLVNSVITTSKESMARHTPSHTRVDRRRRH